MKKELSTLEIRQLVKEFQLLANGRFEKIYQSSPKDFVFKIHFSGGSAFLKIKEKFVYLSNEKGDVPEKPTGFCELLRKNLENRKIRKIWQKDSERIIIFETDSNILLVELFGQGNVVLCDSNYSVISASRVQKEGRIIMPKEKYQFPEEKTDVFKIKEKDFLQLIKSSKTEIVKTIAGLSGGIYAEEACLRADVNKNSKPISEDDAKKVYKSFVSVIEQDASPMIIYEQSPVDAVIADLRIYDGKNKVLFSNFYEAVDSYLSQIKETEKESEVEKRYKKQTEKVENIIKMQEDAIEKLKKEAEQNQRAGELIYEHYQEISKLMNELEEARKKMSWQEIRSRIKNRKIVSIDEKSGTILADI